MSAYLIVKRGLYYRPNGQGYTGIKDNAGRYALDEARDHADEASGVTFIAEADAPDFSAACFHDLALNHLQGKYAAASAALAAAADDLHRIMRTAEMSSGIMLDPQRTGNWPGARKTADAFDRIGLRAAEAKARVRAVIAS